MHKSLVSPNTFAFVFPETLLKHILQITLILCLLNLYTLIFFKHEILTLSPSTHNLVKKKVLLGFCCHQQPVSLLPKVSVMIKINHHLLKIRLPSGGGLLVLLTSV